MKKNLILSMVLGLMACAPKTESVCGVYQGTLPAADAAGIETTLTFDKDNRVLQQLVYIGKNDGAFTEQGRFSTEGEIVRVMFSDEEVDYYRLEKGQLRRLDMNKQPVEGAMANHYILKKVKGCK